jgi:hypothetical protein
MLGQLMSLCDGGRLTRMAVVQQQHPVNGSSHADTRMVCMARATTCWQKVRAASHVRCSSSASSTRLARFLSVDALKIASSEMRTDQRVVTTLFTMKRTKAKLRNALVRVRRQSERRPVVPSQVELQSVLQRVVNVGVHEKLHKRRSRATQPVNESGLRNLRSKKHQQQQAASADETIAYVSIDDIG